MDYGRPSLADALAAQYVAGTLRGRARLRFDALLPSHPALRHAVREWQDRLMPLTSVLAPVPPPPRVWLGITQRLWPAGAVASAAAGPSSVRSAGAAPAASGWWAHLALWRGVAALASVAALGLALLLASPPPAQPPVVVVLQSTGAGEAGLGNALFVAGVSSDGQSLVTRPLTPVNLQADRVLQLWSVPPSGNPRSLGLISANGATVVRRQQLPAGLLKGGTAALAVSIEPPGGSPTGLPTGPVVFAGKLQL